MHIVADGSPGGGTTNVIALAGTLAETRGAEVHLWSHAESYALEQAEHRGLRVRGFKFFSGRFSRGTVQELTAALEVVKPAIVHTHGATTPSSGNGLRKSGALAPALVPRFLWPTSART